MTMMYAGPRRLAFQAFRYEGSPLFFRGPAARLDRPYVAVLGGAMAFGREVSRPYPTRMADALGHDVVNLAIAHAGPDLLLADPAIRRIGGAAIMAVVETPDGWNLSNPFYRVHPRRNDRVIAVSDALRALFPEVEFCDINFTRHLMQALRVTDAERCAEVEAALAETWINQMRQVVAGLTTVPILMHITGSSAPKGVTAGMVRAVAGSDIRVINVAIDANSYAPVDPAHAKIANAIAPVVRVGARSLHMAGAAEPQVAV